MLHSAKEANEEVYDFLITQPLRFNERSGMDKNAIKEVVESMYRRAPATFPLLKKENVEAVIKVLRNHTFSVSTVYKMLEKCVSAFNLSPRQIEKRINFFYDIYGQKYIAKMTKSPSILELTPQKY